MISKINTIIRLRINSDGEGVRTVVFFHDCPLSCVWCCNPETRFGNLYKQISVDELYDLISRDQIYFEMSGGGVTFSGGEPLLYADFIEQFIIKYGNGLNVNIETSLFADFEKVEKLIPYIDEWYIDFKCADENMQKKYTGLSNVKIRDNIKKLSELVGHNQIIITYPIITGVNDSVDNVVQMIEFMKECGVDKVELHPYRKNSEKKYEKLNLEHNEIAPLPNETVFLIRRLFRENGINIIERNVRQERRKCDYLKDIRRKYCAANEIPLKIDECNFKGRCTGTCPKCESELDFINERRMKNA